MKLDASWSEPDEDFKKVYAELTEELQTKPGISATYLAQTNFEKVMFKVNETVTKGIEEGGIVVLSFRHEKIIPCGHSPYNIRPNKRVPLEATPSDSTSRRETGSSASWLWCCSYNIYRRSGVNKARLS
ncbi:MAG: hypothetical protein Ct9H300mP15_28690 [Gemmatimonadota bacterium]|nr:MAG: hypothetical protein Ct9H300mP15_28690 [Gemmatimonadota bacterium]